MSIGARLREERERLRLSQADLAEKVGVSRVTLGRYETDKRDMGSDFLDRIAKLGMESQYILTGEKLDDGQRRVRAFSKVLHILGKELQLDPILMNFAVEKAAEEVESDSWQADQGVAAGVIRDMLKESQILVLDPDLFTEVVEAVETRLQTPQPHLFLPAWKKAQLIMLLYRASRVRRRVDIKVLDEALLLIDPSALSPQQRKLFDAARDRLGEQDFETAPKTVDRRGSAK